MSAPWKMVAHAWKPLKCISREWCHRCGLVRLHNPASEWCAKHGCDADEHPQYRATIRRLTTPEVSNA